MAMSPGSLRLLGAFITPRTPRTMVYIGDIPLHRPYIGLIYGRYLQFRFSMMKKVPSGKLSRNELENTTML